MPTFTATNVSGQDGTIQSWTVPAASADAYYRITARGAASGNFNNGGYPAVISGVFRLTPGQVLKIVVGQRGVQGSGGSAGGGGGSFVWKDSNNELLIAAGGGAGNNTDSYSSTNLDARLDTSGNPGSHAAGGTNGNGGAVPSSGYGGSGAGWLTNGGNAPSISDSGGKTRTDATPFRGGGSAGGAGAYGGFGGGAGTHGNTGGGGGGGGYSGGGGSDHSYGGGGGSYNNGIVAEGKTAALHSDRVSAGQVDIEFVRLANEKPVVSNVQSVSGAKIDPRKTNRISWNYTDPENDPQQKYRITIAKTGNTPVVFSPSTVEGRTGTIQSWTVPSTGRYRLSARGASGGVAASTPDSGRGAIITGDFDLVAGQVIKVLVGQRGLQGTTGAGAGGGGGSFIYNQTTSTLLMAAGGGGGYGGIVAPADAYKGCDASLTTEANNYNGTNTVGGGTVATGAGGLGPYYGGGGAGWNSDGQAVQGGDTFGRRFLHASQPGEGGYGYSVSASFVGGFGGGGGGSSSGDTGGGGGGYTGGNGGHTTDMPGGGGGSYNAGAANKTAALGSVGQTGEVSITLLGPATEYTSANKYHDIAPGTLTDETDYTISVAAYDGYQWSDEVGVNLRSDSWTYGSEVTTATQQVSAGPFYETIKYDSNPLQSGALVTSGGTWSWDAAGFVKQTNQDTAQKFAFQSDIARSSVLDFSVDVTIESDPLNRKHAGLFVQTVDGSAVTGYRITHLDDTWVVSKWTDYNTEVFMSHTAQGNVPMDAGTTVKLRVVIDFTTGSGSLYANGTLVRTWNDTTWSAGRPGYHNYGAVVKYDNLSYFTSALNGDYEAQVRTADASSFGPWSSSTTFFVAGKLAANVTAVPAAITLSTTAPTTGVGKSVYFNAHDSVIVATNLVTDPQVTVGSEINAWTPGATKSIANGIARLDFTAPGNYGGFYTTGTFIEVGKTYSAIAVVRVNRSVTVRLGVEWINPEMNAQVDGAAGPLVELTANQWHIIKAEGKVAPAGAGYFRATVYIDGSVSSWQAGDSLELDSYAIYELPTADSYFDGSSIDPAGRYLYRWTGVANQSASEKLDTQKVAYEDSISPTGLILDWDLSETAGTVVEDSSPNNRDGVFVGKPKLGVHGIPGAVSTNRAVRFDGVDDAASVAYKLPGLFAVRVWFRVLTASKFNVIWSTSSDPVGQNNSGGYVPNLVVNADGSIRAEIWTGSEAESFSVPGSYNDGAWHQAVMIGNTGATAAEVLYVDGELKGSRGPDDLNHAWQNYVHIGAGYSSTSRGAPSTNWHYAHAEIDEFSIWSRVPTAQEIKNDYIRGLDSRSIDAEATAPTVTAENVVWNNAAVEPVTNLVLNPSFEVDFTGWYVNDGWCARDAAFGHSGSACLLALHVAGNTGDLHVVGGLANLKPNTTYTFSAWVRTDVDATWNVGSRQTAYIQEMGGGWQAAGNVIIEAGDIAANTWKLITATFTTQPNWTPASRIIFRVPQKDGVYLNGSNGNFWIDDVQLTETPTRQRFFYGSVADGDTNLALDAAVTLSQGTLNPTPDSLAMTNLSQMVDGRSSSTPYLNVNAGLSSVTVDLGEVKTIDEVRVWHYYGDGRTYHKTKTEVSRDGVTWITIFDSRHQGEYAESSGGMTHNFAPTGVRYIRDWLDGSTANAGNHWLEIQAYHRTANTYVHSWNGTPHNSTSTRKKTLANNLYAPHPHIGASYTLYEDSTPDSHILLPIGPPITIYWNGLFAVPAGLILNAVVPETTVYVMPIAPTYTVKEYQAKFVEGFTRITRRIEILNKDGETLWDDQAGNMSRLITGSVSVDYTRDERRSIDVELANFDNALIHKPGKFWYDKVIRGYRGIEFYDESGRRSYEVPVGTFLIDRVAEARFPKTVKVTGRDFTKRCLLSKFTNATGFEAAEAVEDVIAALAANAGVNNRIFPTTGKTLGTDIVFERGTTRWEAMKQIATAHGYELFFDAQGYLVMRQFLDPTLSPVSHEFKTGLPDGNLITWERAANDTRIFNHISVIGAEAGADTIPVWADAYNTNPLSPTNIDNLGDRVDTYESSLVTTFAQAQELAETFLKISALEEYEINMSSLVFPWLEAGEIVRFLAPDHNPDEPDRFLLTSFTVPLGLGPMEAIGRRVTIVS